MRRRLQSRADCDGRPRRRFHGESGYTFRKHRVSRNLAGACTRLQCSPIPARYHSHELSHLIRSFNPTPAKAASLGSVRCPVGGIDHFLYGFGKRLKRHHADLNVTGHWCSVIAAFKDVRSLSSAAAAATLLELGRSTAGNWNQVEDGDLETRRTHLV